MSTSCIPPAHAQLPCLPHRYFIARPSAGIALTCFRLQIDRMDAQSSTQGRKVALITGVTGQDGSYLTELLLSKGYVVCPSNSPAGGTCVL